MVLTSAEYSRPPWHLRCNKDYSKGTALRGHMARHQRTCCANLSASALVGRVGQFDRSAKQMLPARRHTRLPVSQLHIILTLDPQHRTCKLCENVSPEYLYHGNRGSSPEVSKLTLHSMKSSMLAAASQLGIAREFDSLRAAPPCTAAGIRLASQPQHGTWGSSFQRGTTPAGKLRMERWPLIKVRLTPRGNAWQCKGGTIHASLSRYEKTQTARLKRCALTHCKTSTPKMSPLWTRTALSSSLCAMAHGHAVTYLRMTPSNEASQPPQASLLKPRCGSKMGIAAQAIMWAESPINPCRRKGCA